MKRLPYDLKLGFRNRILEYFMNPSLRTLMVGDKWSTAQEVRGAYGKVKEKEKKPQRHPDPTTTVTNRPGQESP